MSQTKQVKLPPRDKWPEGATHFQSAAGQINRRHVFWRVEEGKARKVWMLDDEFNVRDIAKYGPEGYSAFVLSDTVELPADPVIDWGAAPEEFPLWIVPLGNYAERYKADWHKIVHDGYRDRYGKRWTFRAQGECYVVYRKPEQVTSQPTAVDWSKGPADATHWGGIAERPEEDAKWPPTFYKKADEGWRYTLEDGDGCWRAMPVILPPDRVAALIARPATAIQIKQVIVPEPAPMPIKVVNGSEDDFAALLEAFESREIFTVSGRSFRLAMVGRDFTGGQTTRVRADIQQVVQAAWSGEGVPPPMTPVEFKSVDGDWMPGIYIGKVYDRLLVGCDQTQAVGWLSSEEMRPVRTPEQIEADKRESAARQICIDAGSVQCTEQQMKTAYQLYDKGYRKQVAP